MAEDSIATGKEKNGDILCDNIVTLVNRMVMAQGGYKSDFQGVGIGCPPDLLTVKRAS